MAINRSSFPVKIQTLAGVNYDENGRQPNELRRCSNIFGEASGFSVWRGRAKWTRANAGRTTFVGRIIKPNRMQTHLLIGDGRLQALEIGHFADITGDLTFNTDPRNPTHITQYLRNQYVIGSNYLRDQAWYWDQHIDRVAKPLTLTRQYRFIQEWASRLWGFGNEEDPLMFDSYMLDTPPPDLGNPYFWDVRDGPASYLIAGLPWNRQYMMIWGNKGVWVMERTGSIPPFSSPQLIDGVCDCVSAQSIVRLPDQSFVWAGSETIWMLRGQSVIDIGRSLDPRRASRIFDYYNQRNKNDNYLVNAAYYPRRDAVIFSWPSKRTEPSAPWNDREPLGLVLRVSDLTWWPIDHGFNCLAEVDYMGLPRLISSDEDGYLWLVDYDIQTDKYIDENSTGRPLPWDAEFQWIGYEGRKIKFLNAKLFRRLMGPDKVMVDFYDDTESDPVESYFSIDESYDRPHLKHTTYLTVAASAGDLSVTCDNMSGWPTASVDSPLPVTFYDPNTGKKESVLYTGITGNELRIQASDDPATSLLLNDYTISPVKTRVYIPDWDPGGPHDAGVPPGPVTVGQSEIRITSKYLKVRLHNKDGDDYIDGPMEPMSSLEISGRALE